MIPVFQNGYLNDLAIELGLHWRSITSRMYNTRIEKSSDNIGECLNLWTSPIRGYSVDMYAREDFEALIVIKKTDDTKGTEISLNINDAAALVEAFIHSCTVTCSSYGDDPIPRLKRIWTHLEPKVIINERVEQSN